METPRKPFVEAFREDVADGFLIAGVLGSAYHFVNGGLQAVYKNVPRMSCSSAVFFGVYTAIDYAMVSARRKEEPLLDCAVAGGGANGITNLPRGLRDAGQSALIGVALGGVALGGLRLWNRSPQAQQAGGPGGIPAPASSPTLPVEFPWTPPPVVAEEIRS